MKLNFICRLVKDVPQTVHFWREVMQRPITYYDESIGYASVDTGGTTVAIFGQAEFSRMLNMEIPESCHTYLSFQVENLDTTFADLIRRGAKELLPPQDFPALHARQAYVCDPEGYLIQLYSSLQAQ